MSSELTHKELWQHAAVRNYALLCLTALGVLLFVLLERNLGLWSLFPIIVGSLALALRWRLGPPMVLFTLTGTLYLGSIRLGVLVRPRSYGAENVISDVILCAAMLTYFAANYRLQGIFHAIFPTDVRLPSPQKQKPKPRVRSGQAVSPATFAAPALMQRRSPDAVSAGEIGQLLLGVPLYVLFALLGCVLLRLWEPVVDVSDELWRAMVLTWILGLGTIVSAGFFSYLGWSRLTASEAALFLQDLVWRESRKEQWRLSRWIAWAKIKTARKDKQ